MLTVEISPAGRASSQESAIRHHHHYLKKKKKKLPKPPPAFLVTVTFQSQRFVSQSVLHYIPARRTSATVSAPRHHPQQSAFSDGRLAARAAPSASSDLFRPPPTLSSCKEGAEYTHTCTYLLYSSLPAQDCIHFRWSCFFFLFGFGRGIIVRMTLGLRAPFVILFPLLIDDTCTPPWETCT